MLYIADILYLCFFLFDLFIMLFINYVFSSILMFFYTKYYIPAVFTLFAFEDRICPLTNNSFCLEMVSVCLSMD